MATPPADPGRQLDDLPDEPGDTERGRRAVDRLRRVVHLDRAGVEHGDGVGDRERLVLVVGDDERGGPGAVEGLAHLRAHRLAQRGVERGERLVEEDERRVGGEGPGERDALLLAAGQLVGAAVLEPAQPDEVEHLPDPRRATALRPGQAEGDVLADA